VEERGVGIEEGGEFGGATAEDQDQAWDPTTAALDYVIIQTYPRDPRKRLRGEAAMTAVSWLDWKLGPRPLSASLMNSHIEDAL
jgi:hypothetical protein